MAEFKFKCPQCHEEIVTDDSYRGQVAECPFCHKGIVVPRVNGLRSPRLNTGAAPTGNGTGGGFRRQPPRVSVSPEGQGVDTSSEQKKRGGILRLPRKTLLVCCAAVVAVVIGIICMVSFGGGASSDGPILECKGVDEASCPIDEERSFDEAFQDCVVGTAYINEGEIVRVDQIFLGKGVLVSRRGDRGTLVYVETENEYVDGSTLCPGIYICRGIAQFKGASGQVRTVRAFSQMEKSLNDKRTKEFLQMLADKESKRRKAEAELEFEQQKMELALKVAKEKAAIEERAQKEAQKRELERIRDEQNQKLERERAERKIQEEKAAAAEAARKEEERKRREPEEQRLRGEYAASKLSQITFDVTKHFIVQKGLLRYIHRANPTETIWQDLSESQKKKDWLGMLGLLSGRSLTNYPTLAEIDSMVQNLMERTFHMEFRWTHRGMQVDFYSFSDGTADAAFTVTSMRRRRRGASNELVDEVRAQRIENDLGHIVEFTLNSEPIMVYYRTWGRSGKGNSINDEGRKFKSAYGKLQEDVELGRVASDEAEGKKDALWKASREAVLNVLSTENVILERGQVSPIHYPKEERKSPRQGKGDDVDSTSERKSRPENGLKLKGGENSRLRL